MPDFPPHIQAIIDRLPPDDRDEMVGALVLAEPSRSQRLDERDRAVRDIAALYPGTPSGSAKVIAADLSRYLAGAWLRDRERRGHLGEASEQRRLLFKIAFFGVGASLSWRQILNVIEGH